MSYPRFECFQAARDRRVARVRVISLYIPEWRICVLCFCARSTQKERGGERGSGVCIDCDGMMSVYVAMLTDTTRSDASCKANRNAAQASTSARKQEWII
jgi:hypothetical protein